MLVDLCLFILVGTGIIINLTFLFSVYDDVNLSRPNHFLFKRVFNVNTPLRKIKLAIVKADTKPLRKGDIYYLTSRTIDGGSGTFEPLYIKGKRKRRWLPLRIFKILDINDADYYMIIPEIERARNCLGRKLRVRIRDLSLFLCEMVSLYIYKFRGFL